MQLRLLLITLIMSHTAYAAPFCPWQVTGNERYINLTVVQTLEITDEELRITFGGGNLGSGHEIKLAIKNRAEGLKILQEMKETARRCDAPARN